VLKDVSHNQKNFTAANPAAYGRGTNRGYLDDMKDAGGTVYGGTIFNTALGRGGQNRIPPATSAAVAPAAAATTTVQPETLYQMTQQQADAIKKGGKDAEDFGKFIVAQSNASGKSLDEIISKFTIIGSTIQALPEPPDYGAMFPPSAQQQMASATKQIYAFTEGLRALGPEGEAVSAFANGITAIATKGFEAFEIINSQTADTGQKIQAVIGVLSTALSTINSVLTATSNAKIANIDREIAAEQKRDGKSAESVAKIESLERKKDNIAKKQFNMQKKMAIAQAVMSTAAAIAGQLASPPVGPWNIGLAAAMGVLGAAQIAIIAGTSYQSTANSGQTKATMPAALSIGKHGDSVDLAKNNANAGGEIGYLRGVRGAGKNASDYQVIGSAYGGPVPRGYGNTAFAVGEHGPEIITPDNPISVRPVNNPSDNRPAQPVNFNIQALDASGVQQILMDQRGNIIGMLREAANANGQTFLEDVNVNVYTSPRTSRI
jgi:hypothetical protein